MSEWSPHVVIPLIGTAIPAAAIAVIAGLRTLDKYLPKKAIADVPGTSDKNHGGGFDDGNPIRKSCIAHGEEIIRLQEFRKSAEQQIDTLVEAYKKGGETDTEIFRLLRAMRDVLSQHGESIAILLERGKSGDTDRYTDPTGADPFSVGGIVPPGDDR